MGRQVSFALPAALLMRGVHAAMGAGAMGKAPPASSAEALRRSWVELLRDDSADARAGYYPSSLLTLPTRDVLAQLPRLFATLPEAVWRARRRDHAVDNVDGADDVPVSLPDYYRRAFHWQADGWLSDKSARVYEPSVELLFAGAAGPMRRRALRPLVHAVRGLHRPRIIDIACGAGGFLKQVAAAVPGARLTGYDLSPSYVAHARAELARAGVVADVVVENAESLPLKDALVDALTCVFLFHELPRDARRSVAREMHRVLVPGGTAVVVDAAQVGSTPELKPFLDAFADTYHEPYFRSYQQDSLEDLFTEVGFEVTSASTSFLSRVVVARKPKPR
jgi:ubiquinone/menaquinone biosynthesis C-methylase UbiE